MMQFFRYFKNESENPFEGKDQDKALLFNRYMKTAYSVAEEIPAFKAFYEKWYG